MKILITGATGYIGKKIIEVLNNENHELYAVVRPQSITEPICQQVNEILVCQSQKQFCDRLQELKPQLLINLAGVYFGTHKPENVKEMLEGNVLFPAMVLEAFAQAGGKMVIHTASWQQCYGGKQYEPMNYYAATKGAFENLLYFYTSNQLLRSITLQLFETYGADDTRNKVFNYVRRLRPGESMDMSPGQQKLCFCYITDVVNAYIHAMQLLEQAPDGYGERYAVRDKASIELRKFVELYQKQLGAVLHINWGKRAYMKREIMDAAEIGKILPDWNTRVSYEEGVKLCADYDRQNGSTGKN